MEHRLQAILATHLLAINRLDTLRPTILQRMDHRLQAALTERPQGRVHLLGKGSRPFHLETIRIGISGILIEIHIDLQIHMPILLLVKVEIRMRAMIARGSTTDTVDQRNEIPMHTLQVQHLRQVPMLPTQRILGTSRGTSLTDRVHESKLEEFQNS